MPPLIDLTGLQVGRLTVIKMSGKNNSNQICWQCECSCGNKTEVIGYRLNKGLTLSCGCLHSESVISRNTKNGNAGGLTGTKLYDVYKSMKSRIYNKRNKDYINYGARGIEICEEWRNSYVSFEAWARQHGYREGLSIDRIDNNGNYSPNNCRWVHKKVQANNTRSNHFIECGGKSQTLRQWAEETGIHYYTIYDRLKSGWSVKDALCIKPGQIRSYANEVNA